MKTAEITLQGINFRVEYNPSTDKMEQQSIRVGNFELICIDDKAEEPGELSDPNKMMELVNVSLTKRLLDYLVEDDYKKIYALFKVNPLAIDTATFTVMISYFWMDSDQALELTSSHLVGNTVNGRKYAEHVRNGN